MLNRTIAVLSAVLLLLSLTGCSARQKAADRLAEKMMESALEKATGEDVDIDLDKDKMTAKGEDGSELSIGGGEWPKSGAGVLLPELKKGKITSVLNSAEGCWLQIEEVSENDFHRYVETLKEAGFVTDEITFTNEDNQSFTARLEGKGLVSANYSQDGSIFITLSLEVVDE